MGCAWLLARIDPHRRLAPLAVVRRARRARSPEQALDGAVRRRRGHRSAAVTAAPRARPPLDLARRRCRAGHLPAQHPVAGGARLPDAGGSVQRPRDGQERVAVAGRLRRPADAHHAPGHFPIWLVGLVSLLVGRLQALPRPRLDLPRLLVDHDRPEGEELLPGADLPDAARGRRVTVEGRLDRWAASRGRRWAHAAILACIVVAGAVLVADLPADPAARPAGGLPGGARPRAAQDRGGSRRAAAAVLRRPVRLAGAGAAGGRHLLVAAGRRSARAPAIFASNYGEAGALNLFGPALGLPSPICAHQNHWLLGPAATSTATR